MTEQSIKDIDFSSLLARTFYPSPAAWEDEVLYFLMLDRFSDGREDDYIDNSGQMVSNGTTPPYAASDINNACSNESDFNSYLAAGHKFVGGSIKGLASKLGYIKRLGATAIWISPIFKQVAFEQTYHGYGVQNFLDVDPHFGTRADLQQLVAEAHSLGIRVILDIILNHSGDVFAYDPDRYWNSVNGGGYFDTRWDGNIYNVKGFRDASGIPSLPLPLLHPTTTPSTWPDGAIWPSELHNADTFTAKGHINNWDYDPEFREGDFLSLKDINLGSGTIDNYECSTALNTLCQAYKFWIAFADIDGFRIDTVKHMDPGATRFFAAIIHEFAQSIGKENFYLIGEITGGRERAFRTLEETGLDAALGIDDIPDKLEYLVKGYRNPTEYFSLFRNSLLVQKESHTWFKNKVVTTFDDHDQVRKGTHKSRFCNPEALPWDPTPMALCATALMCTTIGIPCIYYGTEQAFAGNGQDDCFLREAMFGGKFGAFRTKNRHFFRENFWLYKELAKILNLRRQNIALRRGRQYLRPISGDGVNFGLPEMIGGEIRSVVPWSRIFTDKEVVVAINTDPIHTLNAWTTIDNFLHQNGEHLTCLYSSNPLQVGTTCLVEARNGKAILLTMPPAGVVIFG